MANTLKLGDGKWATGKDTVLAFNDENNNFKPLPFSFSRASSATVVNKDGLIEIVGVGEPRIDFKDNTKGALLLEPQRTNYQPYSTNFSVWSAADVTLSLNYGLSPDGLNDSTLITEGTGSAQHRVSKASPSSSGIYTFSCFVKNKVGNHQAYIDMGTVTGFFNFDTKTMYSATGTTNVESWSNDWYRISITSNSNVTPIASYIGIGKNNTETFQGDGSSAIEFFGAQLEQGSYATSYIPTSGSAVTRSLDATIGNLPSSSIGQSEGVVYFEGSYLDTSEQGYIQISDGTSNNRIIIWNLTSTLLRGYIVVGGAEQAQITGGIISNNTTFKVALKYKTNDFALWFNGVEVGVDPFGSTFGSNVLNKLDLQFSSVVFEGEVKDLKLYNTALTNAELQALTTL